MKVLVLGHKGMLGRAVTQYYSQLPNYEVATTSIRFGEDTFSDEIRKIAPDFIINCIGKIPQKKPLSEAEYSNLNRDLPLFLDTLDIKVVHPTTDCEFRGDIPPGTAYTKNDRRDADDAYGTSKAQASQQLEESGNNTKIIRTSIIGHEENTSLSLLDWFLSQQGSTRGYTNHFWNGITTLEWAKQCHDLIENWDTRPKLNQLGTTTHYSKFEIITIAKNIYQKDIEIIPFATDTTVNKCLLSDRTLPELEIQLKELKTFFNK